METFFLVLLLLLGAAILYICRDKNAWDVLAFNSVLGIVALFMIGILAGNAEVWLRIVSFLGVVATGSAFAAVLSKKS